MRIFKTLFTLLLFFLFSLNGLKAQDSIMSLKPVFSESMIPIPVRKIDTSTSSKGEEIYNAVEKMPQFPGGEEKFIEYLMRNSRYTDDAREANISGKIIISFVVTESGKIENIKIERGIFPSLDSNCYKCVANMPDWIPGTNNGKAVKVSYSVPFVFEVEEYKSNSVLEKPFDHRPKALIRALQAIDAKNYDGALKIINKELSKNMNQAVYIAYKGLVNYNMGDAERACFYFQTAIEVGNQYGYQHGISEAGMKELISKCCNSNEETAK